MSHSPIAEFASWADAPVPETECVEQSLIDRLLDGVGKCQMFSGGSSYSEGPVRECGADGRAAEITPPSFRVPREKSRTRLFLCPDCFLKSSRRRPTRWLN